MSPLLAVTAAVTVCALLALAALLLPGRAQGAGRHTPAAVTGSRLAAELAAHNIPDPADVEPSGRHRTGDAP